MNVFVYRQKNMSVCPRMYLYKYKYIHYWGTLDRILTPTQQFKQYLHREDALHRWPHTPSFFFLSFELSYLHIKQALTMTISFTENYFWFTRFHLSAETFLGPPTTGHSLPDLLTMAPVELVCSAAVCRWYAAYNKGYSITPDHICVRNSDYVSFLLIQQ